MGGDPRTTTLGVATDLLTGYPFSSARFTDDPTGTRLLRGDNVAQGFIRWDGVRRWPASDCVNSFLLRPGDVILAMDRPWIEAGLKHATLTEADCPSLLVQRVACLRARSGLNQRFLSYVIRSQAFTDYVLGVQTGTAVPHISGSQIRAYEFHLPPPTLQQAAADLLGSLDDKIELNRRMAETLEAMARALFRSWFVDFDPIHARAQGRPTDLPHDLAPLFPDSFGEEGLPDGWRALPLNTLCNLDRTTCDPSTFGQRIVSHFSIPAYDNGRRPAVEAASKIKSLKLRLTAPIVLFSKLNPDTPRIWPIASMSNPPALASTEYLALRPARPNASYAYLALLLSSQPFVTRAASMVTGTSKSHQRVQAEALMATTWVVSPPGVLQAFDKRAEPLLARAEAARNQCETLAGLRDTLLPKLISGELRVADAEHCVAAA